MHGIKNLDHHSYKQDFALHIAYIIYLGISTLAGCPRLAKMRLVLANASAIVEGGILPKYR